ncbi:MAG: YjgB family protein, partial [Bacillus sp. (in: Bacteria)]|nr:YjgB family protein [Bacillus sp. (in: firmicutes)]
MAKLVNFSLILLLLLITACDDSKNRDIPIDDVQEKQTDVQLKGVLPSSKLLNEIKDKSKVGLVKGSEFSALESTVEQVKKKWGEPDSVDHVGSGYY